MWNKKCEIKLYWTTTIWPKWQLVIPKEIRNILWLNTGDSMTVLLKDNKFIWIVRNDDVNELMEYIENEKKSNLK
jgi:AbrB family looped-hinge helix DNA binding protein